MRDKILAILENSTNAVTLDDFESELDLIEVSELDALNENLKELEDASIISKTENGYTLNKTSNEEIIENEENKEELKENKEENTSTIIIDFNKDKESKNKKFNFKNINLSKKSIAIIVLIAAVALTFTMSSYAWLSATNASDKTNTITSGDLSLVLKDTASLSLANSYPVKDATGLKSSPYSFSITNNGTLASSYTIYLKDNDLADGKTRIGDDKLKYSLVKDKNIYTGAKALNTLTTTDNGRVLATGTIDPNETINFDLRVWIDEAVATDSSGLSFAASINLKGEQLSLTPNEPNISAGMVPVTYDSAKGSFVKADGTVTDNWYNYTNKNWANIALINDSTYLDTLNNSPVGTSLDGSKVLGYFVWIPRMSYSYKTLPFNVRFISKTTSEDGDVVYTGSTPENFYTSGAFTFDTDLDGFYISKYEATGTASAVTSLPGVASLRSANVSTLSNAISSMTTNISSFNGDIHMAKNSEWEMAAILAESSYGINGAIEKNSNASYLTASGASTTGNTTGIYDMVGGSSEYVMGLYNGTVGNSGFTTLPDSKYYDNYDDSSLASNVFTVTKNLYNGAFTAPSAAASFIVRGDSVSDTTSSIFTMKAADGSANASYGTRIVITNK